MAKQLSDIEKAQHSAVLSTAQHNLQLVTDALETLNSQANYDDVLEYLDNAKEALAKAVSKVV